MPATALLPRRTRLPAAPLAGLAGRLRAAVAEESGRALPLLVVAVAAGVLLYFQLPSEPPAWLGAGALGLAALAARALRGRRAAAVAWALAAVALGLLAGQAATWRAAPLVPLTRGAVMVEGVVGGVDVLPQGRRVTLLAPSLGGGPALARSLRIRLRGNDPAALAAGDRVRLRALIEPPPPAAYPGGWDLRRDAFFAGGAGSGFAIGPATVLGRGGVGLARWWQGVREAIAGRVLADLPGPRGAVAATLLTGSSTALPEADRAAFRDSGLAHLLAVAGLHIAIVMGLAMAAARLALAACEWTALHWPTKQVAAVFALAAGGLYAALTGLHLPILRSLAMAALVTLGLLAGRRALSIRGLALAALALLLASPDALLGASFQMSFSAVLALIAGYAALRPWLARLHGEGAPRWAAREVAALLLTSLLAGTASAPFAAYHFGHVQLYFVLGNLVAVPLAAFWVMPAGLAALALMPAGLAWLALAPMGWGIGAIIWVARTVSSLPAATLPLGDVPGGAVALYGLGLAWLCLLRSRLRLLGLVPLLAGLAWPALSRPPDLLLAADGGAVGLRAGATAYAAQGLRAESRFVLAQWAQLWGVPDLPSPPDSGTIGRLACTPDACRLTVRGRVALVPRPGIPAHGALCAGAALVVVAGRGAGACRGVARLDAAAARQAGAVAVWLGRKRLLIRSDADVSGHRPWSSVPAPLYPQSALPFARSE